MKNILSAFLIVLSLCAIITFVVLVGNFCRISSRSCSVTVSILAVASSRINNSGFLRNARMNAISCFCQRLIDSELVTILVSSHHWNLFTRSNRSAFFRTSVSCSLE